MMTGEKESEVFQALKELVESGDMSWADAVQDFRKETGASVSYCLAMGIIYALKKADKNYNR